MSKLFSSLITGACLSASVAAFAADEMKPGMMMDMSKMDANGDGMISKSEFMKHQESMFNGMKKNKDGMVMMKDMQMMNSGMMKDDHMKNDPMMKDKMRK